MIFQSLKKVNDKKTIIIFCQSLDKNLAPFADPYYWDAYSDLVLILQELGADAYFATDNAMYVGKGIFSEVYALPHKGSVDTLQKMQNIRADLVFDRGDFASRDVPVVNPDYVSRVGASKITTYELFAEYQAFSIPCYSKDELLDALKVLKTDTVVVKKAHSNGGIGVDIGKRQDIIDNLPDEYPVLAQEFVDTSIGIPGLIKGMHDLRVEVGGGEIWGCYIRVPKPGSFKANVAQGGSKLILSHNDVPAKVVKIVHELDAYFKNYPRFYGLDFAHTTEGWKLTEINTKRLGLVAKSGGSGSEYTLYKLAQYLIDVAR